jgi:hypothetical protein
MSRGARAASIAFAIGFASMAGGVLACTDVVGTLGASAGAIGLGWVVVPQTGAMGSSAMGVGLIGGSVVRLTRMAGAGLSVATGAGLLLTEGRRLVRLVCAMWVELAHSVGVRTWGAMSSLGGVTVGSGSARCFDAVT